jgi:polar amino acid transport system permease protein
LHSERAGWRESRLFLASGRARHQVPAAGIRFQVNWHAPCIVPPDIICRRAPQVWSRDCASGGIAPLDLRFFEIYRSAEYLLLLLQGAAVSGVLTVAGGVAGFILAGAIAAARYYRVPLLSHLAAAYVELIRNTPLIVQMFFVAFGLPLLLGYQWPFWAHALLALTLNFSAYFAEILRAGLAAVPAGQAEAAAALGLPKWLGFARVLFPQAVASMFPSLNSQFIFLFLTTGVISEIGVTDLTWAGLYIDSRSFRSFEVFFTLTVIYVAMSLMFKTLLAIAHDHLFKWKATR